MSFGYCARTGMHVTQLSPLRHYLLFDTLPDHRNPCLPRAAPQPHGHNRDRSLWTSWRVGKPNGASAAPFCAICVLTARRRFVESANAKTSYAALRRSSAVRPYRHSRSSYRCSTSRWSYISCRTRFSPTTTSNLSSAAMMPKPREFAGQEHVVCQPLAFPADH